MKLNSPTYSSNLEKPLYGSSALLVDDNPINVKIAENFLLKWGAEVEVAMNGLQAVELFKANHYHLIIMDLHMPVMSGFEASTLIREYEACKGIESGFEVPIIAFTADVFIPDSTYDQHGISDKIYKPFEPDVFKQMMTSYSLTNRSAV